MPTQLITSDITLIEAQRIADAKAKFSLQLLPFYRRALSEDRAFLAAARVLVLDRFPPLGLDPSSKEYQDQALVDAEVFELHLFGCGALLSPEF